LCLFNDIKIIFLPMLIQKPKGTNDLLPEKARQRYFLETKVRQNFEIYNFSEILTPTFEKTELFKRETGEETVTVSKQMYTFKNDEFIFLLPMLNVFD